MKIKQGLMFKDKAGKTGKVGELFEPRERWDEPHDPEWYVHFEGHDLKILPESVIRPGLVVDPV